MHADDILAHFDDLREEAGVELTYSRGVTTWTPIEAVKARRRVDRVADDDLYGTLKTDDFLVRAADFAALAINEPQILDRVVWTDPNGNEKTHVVSVDGSERAYDDLGDWGVVWRVHTAEVAV